STLLSQRLGIGSMPPVPTSARSSIGAIHLSAASRKFRVLYGLNVILSLRRIRDSCAEREKLDRSFVVPPQDDSNSLIGFETFAIHYLAHDDGSTHSIFLVTWQVTDVCEFTWSVERHCRQVR